VLQKVAVILSVCIKYSVREQFVTSVTGLRLHLNLTKKSTLTGRFQYCLFDNSVLTRVIIHFNSLSYKSF